MKHVWVVAVVAACASSPAPSPSPQPVSEQKPADPRIAKLEASIRRGVPVVGEDTGEPLEARMRELEVPAVSIAVFENYQLVWAKAYGMADPVHGVAATPETMFQAASISKPVNALGVLLAVADGTLLSLDTPINDQLTSWKLPASPHTQTKQVTLRHLLSHTGGTTVHGFPGYAAGAALPTAQQVLDGVPPANTTPVRVDIPLGTFRYSGGGTTITQVALVDRSKRPYAEILEQRVLGPLGMKHSTFQQPLPAAKLASAAVGAGPAGSVIPGERHTYPEQAPAGLWTTPTDLATFLIEVARGRAGTSSLISKQIAADMTTPVVEMGDTGIGLGMFISSREGIRFFGHGGANEGFRCNAIASMQGGYGVVVMTNSDNGGQLAEEITNSVFSLYAWPGATPAVQRFAMSAPARATFVGAYGGTQFVPLLVEDDAGKLYIRRPFGARTELIAISETVLIGPNGERFSVAANGALAVLHAGRPGPALTRVAGTHPLVELAAGRFDAAVTAWRARLTKDSSTAAADESGANLFGYDLIGKNAADAVLVFRLISAVFPDSANALDSLGDGYVAAGDTANAIATYERVLTVVDKDPRIPGRRAEYRARATKRIEELRAKK